MKLTQLKNALAWYAGEEVARDFDNLMECKEDICQNHLKTAEAKLTKYADSKILKLKGELKRLENYYEI